MKTNMRNYDQINHEKLNELFGNDADFKEVVFKSFVDEIDAQINDLQNAYDLQNWELVQKNAHKIKPSFGMVGFIKAESELKAIENSLKTGTINVEIKQKTLLFLENFLSLKQQVIEELNTLQS